MDKKRRICWDSSCLIAIMRNEAPHAATLRNIVRDAEEGNVLIVLSAMAITEVVRPRGSNGPISIGDIDPLVRDIFDAPYVLPVGHSRPIAELGRKFVWANGSLHPHDSIHIATAVYTECEALETCEGNQLKSKGGILKLTGLCDGLEIRHPRFVGQAVIERPRDEKAATS